MALLEEAGAVGFTDGHRALADSLVMRRAMAYASALGGLIVQHPEDPALAEGGAMNEGEIATRLGLAGIPAVAEVIMIERDLRLVELTGCRYHVAHISTAAAVDAVRRAKARGLPVTAEAAPHHFALNELEVEGYRTFAKVSPPLRSEDDRRAVVAGLADGTIDVIASDHCPQDQDSKRLPFAQAEFGVVGLETLLPVALQLVHDGSIEPARGAGEADLRARRSPGPGGRPPAPGRTGGSRPVRPRGAVADARGGPAQPIQEHAVRGPPVQGKVLRTMVDGRTI